MKRLAPLRKYGKLTSKGQQDYLYQLTGQPLGLEYRCELVITDFQGQGWHSAFSLEDMLESMTEILPEPEQLRSWLDELKSPELDTTAEAECFMDAHVQLNASTSVQIRLPPTGGLKPGKDTELHDIHSVVAFGLFDAYESHEVQPSQQAPRGPDATRVSAKTATLVPPHSVNKDLSQPEKPNRSERRSAAEHHAAASDLQASDDEPSKNEGATSAPEGSCASPESTVGRPKIVPGRAGRGGRAGRRPARGGLKIARQ
ncbi:hypothetical protein WJX84_006683 [Apatococcus fuscideae]|uniref:Uncharacterized protein n=1 Tax=Apatococcus fuscideae TaxID=2026836 RepID=A0AAW1S954_9CHLO